MRRRLAASYVLLLVLVLAALEVPLAIATASSNSQRIALDRLADAVQFASTAETAMTSEARSSDDPADPSLEGRPSNDDDSTDPSLEGLRTELERYEQMYGIAALVVDRDRKTLISSRPGLTLVSADARRQRDHALAGDQPDASRTFWPWEDRPMVIAAPIGSGGETLGAVITISPTDRLRDRTGQVWLLLTGGGLLALVVFILMALALARWTLRPIADLDSAVHHIADGDYDARVPAAGGPPELRRLATAFNEMVSTVSDVLERQRAFVSHASHQLRNPLTALRLRVEDLSEAVPGEEGRTALQERPTACPRCSTGCSRWPAPRRATSAWRRSTPTTWRPSGSPPGSRWPPSTGPPCAGCRRCGRCRSGPSRPRSVRRWTCSSTTR
ncbi:HAMP domain-containing protein [Virgisporangium aurantiacum]|uniref:histidine kinase n=1 Tax=Virgisporangium aurantiacum TaxID=175570 RepID=A0A8J3ZCY0_9ACTN|nr:HAMP domain-containing protein [Virgisporangium aurantiacum]GIJ60592.1 hypothetical protein Vau01_081080 [Virgisporangium aurantiacum]